MRMMGFASVAAAALLGTACSGTPQRQDSVSMIGDFRPSSQTRFNGTLLEVGSGGRLGVITINPANSEPERLYVETILIQRQPASSPVDATSQVIEVDCGRHRHRIIANLGYQRDGTLLEAVPVETLLTDFAVYQRVYDKICDGSYARAPVAKFTTIAEFLDFFVEVPPASRAAPPPTLTPA